MGTNTASNLLVADGTNFNSVAISSFSEISTVANDDVFLAIDTSGGGLKKIARSAVVAGLATSSAISNVVEDTTPQLGGNLDMNGADIVTTSNADLELAPNGTGHVTVRGNTNSGAIQFNCEQNSHGQIVIGAAHSAGADNTLTLPSTGGNSTIVSDASTSTLTNKTLTSPVINTGTFGTSILPTSADGTTLGSASKEFSDLFLADASTIQFGNDQEIKLTHVADTGLLLTDSGGSPTLQFHDANESFSSDGSKIIMISGGTTFNMPTSDGTDGQALATDGSGTLSFVSVAANTPSSADGQALGSASLEWSDLFLADGGTIQFGNDQDTILTHTDGSGLTLNSTNKLMFNDASQFIQGASATVLDIAATDEIELTATLIDVVGNFANSGTITSAVMTAGGSGYTYGIVDLGSLQPSGTLSDPAKLIPIIPPSKGHGYDIYTELGTDKVLVYARFDDSTRDFPVDTRFTQVGIIKNPQQFSSTAIYTASDYSSLFSLKLNSVTSTPVVGAAISQSVSGGAAKGYVASYDSETRVLKYFQDRSLYFGNTKDETDSGDVSSSSKLLSFESSSANISPFTGSIDTGFSGIKTTVNTKEIDLGVTFTDGLANPEINKKTGEIIYIDNRPLIQRDSRQKEDVKIILEF